MDCLFSLNPCFRGSWFDTMETTEAKTLEQVVLILVFVEVGLIHKKQLDEIANMSCLNPCFRGSWFDTWRNCW